MGGLVWTAILYFSTLSIVYIIYRTFVNDRKDEAVRKTNEVVLRTQAQAAKAREAAARSPTPRRTIHRPAIGDIKVPVAR